MGGEDTWKKYVIFFVDFYSNILRNQWDAKFRKPPLQISKISMKNYESVILIILTVIALTICGLWIFMHL